MTFCEVHPQGSEGWLKPRAGKIKASVCAAYEGIHPYMSVQDLVRQEVRAILGAESEFQTNAAVEHGSMMEEYARVKLEEIKRYRVEENGLVIHQEHKFLAASPDGLVGIEGGCEFKCPFPKWTKAPYSVFDEKRIMYLWQCHMVMEVCDLDWCDFMCYLATDPQAEGQWHIDRVQRNWDWLDEELDGRLLPEPSKGKVTRLDLYKAWYDFIQEEAADPVRAQKHLDPLVPDYEEIEDAQLTELADVQGKINEIEVLNHTALAELEELKSHRDSLKKELVKKYERSITNGWVSIQVIQKTPPVDYRRAFEFLGGEQALLEKDSSLDTFRRTNNSLQSSIKTIGDD